MDNYKHLRRVRKIKKVGKRLGLVVTFLAISYLISLASYYLYIHLSEILMPVNKNILGFAVIGLMAGSEAVLVSLINKKFVLTVVISFIIDCLVDSIILFSTLGMQVIQFLPGLLASMLLVSALWHLVKIKLIPHKEISGDDEEKNRKYTLARKLIKDPNKITLELFKEVCGALEGINPKIDKILKEADRISRTIDFLGGGDPIGFVVCNIKVKTKKDKERKEKLLFFIDLVNDIRDEVNAALVRVEGIRIENNIGNQNNAANFVTSAIGPTSIATISTAIIAASTIGVAQAAGVMPVAPFLLNSEKVVSEGIITPSITGNVEVSITLTPTPLPTPTPKPVLVFSTVEKTFFVSAVEEGTYFTASSTGTYRFTITGGAYYNNNPTGGWDAKVMIYKSRPIDWSGPNETHTNWDYLVGFPGDRDPNEKLTREEVEPLGKGSSIDIFMNKDEYLIFMVFDSKGDFGDNQGGMDIQVQKGTLSYTNTNSELTVNNGWGYFARIFNGPPGSNMGSYIDYTMIAMYVTVHNNDATEDRIIGGVSDFCNSITFDDMSINGPDGTIPYIVIPAKSTVVMDFMKAERIICNGAKSGLKQGDRITMGLIFEKYGQVPVSIEIRATPE